MTTAFQFIVILFILERIFNDPFKREDEIEGNFRLFVSILCGVWIGAMLGKIALQHGL